MNSEEQDYYIRHFYEQVLLNAPHYSDFTESDIQSKLDMLDSEKLIYRKVAFDVYEKLRRENMIVKMDNNLIFHSLTPSGRQESERLKEFINPKQNRNFFKRAELFVLNHEKELVIGAIITFLGVSLTIILHYFGLV